MIDEKKIEEAARNYCNNRYPASQDAPFIAEGFRHGAYWAINEFLKNLWHSVDEEPKLGKRLLVKVYGNLFLSSSGFVVEHLRNFDDNYGIESWLYIDDLFSKKGDKQ